jgi:hypothetical protein
LQANSGCCKGEILALRGKKTCYFERGIGPNFAEYNYILVKKNTGIVKRIIPTCIRIMVNVIKYFFCDNE